MADAVQAGLWRLTVRIANATPWHGRDRDSALQQAFVSTHTLLHVEGGGFISLMDPPEALKQAAAACANLHTWPVLVGQAGERHTMLSSPIILYDYPQIAPESPGDLFDGTEIDQLLTLNILALTDAEKAEMRASDPRARQILERTESLTAADLLRLHGAIRDFQRLREAPALPPLWQELERPAPPQVVVRGVEIRQGSPVRLRPRAGGDILDLALAGKVAIVEAIEQDYEGRVQLVVTLEDDPGRDLGRARQPGHCFFFAPDEVEPLDADRRRGS
jgi:hypothetical protein